MSISTSHLGRRPQDIPLNQYLGRQAYLDEPPQRPIVIAHHFNDDSAARGSSANKITTSIANVNFREIIVDNCGGYDRETGRFTVPQRGVYRCFISGNLGLNPIPSDYFDVQVWLNGSQYLRGYHNEEIKNLSSNWLFSSVNHYVPAEKGDYIEIRAFTSGNNGQVWWDDDGNYSQMGFQLMT